MNVLRWMCFCYLFITYSCSTSDYVHDLGDDYILISESNANQFISGPNDTTGNGLIPCTVERFEYDNAYIIAEQKDNPDCLPQEDYESKEAKYWIIHKEKQVVYGPFDWETFMRKRDELGISLSISK
ncbi:DUF3997 domain-containing protein [Parapedobacter sp. 10938]|uniref:DUF3997 domain-containing protein n=1 Tax=Parapedobacter flavus TaxID=3110225 RepID=UPI002DB986B6|nr:DUF3997 domain-containing protein [Parapedobacter sp. 10938]MEC3882047.1 DUF3997 domain-containing protein [Parapedobacter sp. 10938]